MYLVNKNKTELYRQSVFLVICISWEFFKRQFLYDVDLSVRGFAR